MTGAGPGFPQGCAGASGSSRAHKGRHSTGARGRFGKT
ncbi:hypothetical protein C4K23_0716 [Pseudomonas chlororaphis]|nr:hypothetical protein C4K23_0716 [Pseudomonas chlororaphis]AZD52607.1 hypothetical protein C4K19_0793 [Pseudomonas chlororaphis subsp. aurantiaca]AZD83588.1 hypothetical protein C4K14_0737 [Pseudomonas chlororaphis subsp. aureofaciens]AZD58723.1 hypothetical protein C4K18_0723 [Pseudomonas chlororaphis subsp. aurantiaca]AZD90170.1 hypothetical protein C4K13_0726 [Pseudomonas chlororaphis subsp. aureofaciens]